MEKTKAIKKTVLQDKEYQAIWNQLQVLVHKAGKLKDFADGGRSELIIYGCASNVSSPEAHVIGVRRCNKVLSMQLGMRILQ